MSVARKVAYNTIAQIFGRGMGIVLSLVLIRFLTSYLKTAGYGDYTITIAFVAIFAIIADFGLSMIVVRDLAKKESDAKEYLGNVLALRGIVALVVLGLAPLVVLLFSYSHLVNMAILIVALASYFLSLNQVFVGVFQANLRMDKAVISDVLGRAVALVLSLLFIHYHQGLLMIVGAILVGNLVNLGLSWLMVRAYIRPTLRFNWVRWRKLFRDSLPMGVVLVLGMIYFRSDMIILSVIKGNEAVGIYGVAYRFVDILVALPAFFMGAVFPFIANLYGHDNKRLNDVLQRATEVLIIVALPVAVIFSILAGKWIGLVATPDFAPASRALQILIWGVMISFLTQLPNYTLAAIGKQAALIGVYLFLIAENVILNLIFIPHYSYLAAATTTSLTEIFAFAGSWWLLYRFTGFQPKTNVLIKALGAAIIMAGVVWGFRNYFGVALVSGIFVYGLILVANGTMSRRKLLNLISLRGQRTEL